MRGTEPQIRATILEGLDELLKSYSGLNVGLSQLLEEVGVRHCPSGEPLSELPLNAFGRLLETAARLTETPCFGLRFAAAYPVGGTGVLGYFVNNAPDLQSMLACLSRYARLQVDDFQFEFVETHSLAELTFRFGAALNEPRKQMTEFVMALCVHRVRRLLGDDWRPRSATFDYREPNCGGEYEQLFGTNLKFDADVSRLTAPIASLKRQNRGSDSQLFKLLSSIADNELAKLKSSEDLVDQLGAYIIANLAVHGVDLEHAAGAVKLSPRKLQGELARRGTNFEEQVSQVRQRLARHYLHDSDLPMTEIALILGFSELSVFTRAARHWFGTTPTEMRQELRSGSRL